MTIWIGEGRNEYGSAFSWGGFASTGGKWTAIGLNNDGKTQKNLFSEKCQENYNDNFFSK